MYAFESKSKAMRPDASGDFFWDVPWGSVPASRLGIMYQVATLPKGRLLGGSSKLAALAAARKKKEAERAATAAETSTDRFDDLLDRLGKDKPARSDESSKPTAMTFPTRQKKQKEPEPSDPPIIKEDPKSPEVPKQDLKASPSVFANTLLGGNGTPDRDGVSLQAEGDVSSPTQPMRSFKLPYMNELEVSKQSPFAKPSPDDVVLRAQGRDS